MEEFCPFICLAERDGLEVCDRLNGSSVTLEFACGAFPQSLTMRPNGYSGRWVIGGERDKEAVKAFLQSSTNAHALSLVVGPMSILYRDGLLSSVASVVSAFGASCIVDLSLHQLSGKFAFDPRCMMYAHTYGSKRACVDDVNTHETPP